MELQAKVWYEQGRFEEAKSEALRAIDIYEKFGTEEVMDSCRTLLQEIQKELNGTTASG